jgi:hypothetical protein
VLGADGLIYQVRPAALVPARLLAPAAPALQPPGPSLPPAPAGLPAPASVHPRTGSSKAACRCCAAARRMWLTWWTAGVTSTPTSLSLTTRVLRVCYGQRLQLCLCWCWCQKALVWGGWGGTRSCWLSFPPRHAFTRVTDRH